VPYEDPFDGLLYAAARQRAGTQRAARLAGAGRGKDAWSCAADASSGPRRHAAAPHPEGSHAGVAGGAAARAVTESPPSPLPTAEDGSDGRGNGSGDGGGGGGGSVYPPSPPHVSAATALPHGKDEWWRRHQKHPGSGAAAAPALAA